MPRIAPLLVAVTLATLAGDARAGANDKRFEELSRALAELGIELVKGTERVEPRDRGRRDLVAQTKVSLDAAVKAARNGYRLRHKKKYAGFTVVGLAKLNLRKSWSITLRRGQTMHIVEVWQGTDGTSADVALWGIVLDRGFRRRAPLRPLPPPVMPRVKP